MYQDIKNDLLKKFSNSMTPTLIAVSKFQPIDKIANLIEQGQVHFGENYIQEALEKIDHFKRFSNLRWHLIGSLQKNKVKYLRDHFYMIHSVDSLELAQLISKKSLSLNYVQNILLQVNLADENSKSGFSALELTQQVPQLLELKGLRICGLMTMPPLQNDAENNRKYFRQLRELLIQLQISIPTLHELSMGTSSDYLVALEEGATMIRLGTILFGERQKK